MTRELFFELLEQESQARKKRTNQIRVAILLTLGVVSASVGYQIARGTGDLSSIISSVLPILAVVGASAGMSVKGKAAILLAASSKDPAVVKYLVESLDSGDAELVKLTKSSLADMLPTLRLDYLEQLDESHLTLLRNSLSNHDPVLGPAAAITLSRLADRPTVALLEAIRDSKSVPANLKSAATNALPDLRMTIAKQIIDKKLVEAEVNLSLHQES
jgi:hypothetical protein